MATNSKDYMRGYAAKRREQERGMINVTRFGHCYTLIRAKQARLLTKRHPPPCYMGQEGYVLKSVVKLFDWDKSKAIITH